MTGAAAAPDYVSRLQEHPGGIVVTGSTGWFGRTALELLHEVLGPASFRAKVRPCASRARTFTLAGGHEVYASLLDDVLDRSGGTLLFLHLAALTPDLVHPLGIGEYLRRSLDLTARTISAFERLRPEAVVYTSSGAVYGKGGAGSTDMQANPYGLVKHIEEKVFRATADDVGARSVVARVFSVSGPHIHKPEVYALRDLLEQATTSDRILIRAHRPVIRTYSAVRDILAVAMATALDDNAPPHVTFDTGGERVELEDLAARIRSITGRYDRPIIRSLDPTLDADVYAGDGSTMVELAARYQIPLLDLEGQIEATAAFLATRPD